MQGVQLEEALTWVSVAKAALGPFFGAALALLINEAQRRRKESRDDCAVGNLALFQIWRYLSDVYLFRATLRHQVASKLGHFDDAPDWALLLPSMVTWDKGSFEFAKLSFLLSDDGGRRAMQHARHAELLHFDISATHEVANNAAEESQRESVKLFRSNRAATWPEIADHLGPAVIAKAGDLFRALLIRAEMNVAQYQTAFETMNCALRSRFGTRVWPLSPDPKGEFSEANIAPLPKRLQEFLANLPS